MFPAPITRVRVSRQGKVYGTTLQHTKDMNIAHPIMSFCHSAMIGMAWWWWWWAATLTRVQGAAIGKDGSFLGLPILLKPGTKTAIAPGMAPYATTGVGSFAIDASSLPDNTLTTIICQRGSCPRDAECACNFVVATRGGMTATHTAVIPPEAQSVATSFKTEVPRVTASGSRDSPSAPSARPARRRMQD